MQENNPKVDRGRRKVSEETLNRYHEVNDTVPARLQGEIIKMYDSGFSAVHIAGVLSERGERADTGRLIGLFHVTSVVRVHQRTADNPFPNRVHYRGYTAARYKKKANKKAPPSSRVEGPPASLQSDNSGLNEINERLARIEEALGIKPKPEINIDSILKEALVKHLGLNTGGTRG